MNRRAETVVITKIDDDSITVDEGWSYSPGRGVLEHLEVGMELTISIVQGSKVVGITSPTVVWILTDEGIEAEHQRFVARLDAERKQRLVDNETEWQRREAALPDWLKARLAEFHKSPTFKHDGWGYELCVAELAVLYTEPNSEETTDVYARTMGTSGNQHQFAKALASQHLAGKSAKGTVSALTFLTGEPYYVKKD